MATVSAVVMAVFAGGGQVLVTVVVTVFSQSAVEVVVSHDHSGGHAM